MKNKQMGLVSMAEKGSKTILHRLQWLYRKHKNMLKTIKLIENTDIWKAMAVHFEEKQMTGRDTG